MRFAPVRHDILRKGCRCGRRSAGCANGGGPVQRALPGARHDGADELHGAGAATARSKFGCRPRCRRWRAPIAAQVAGVAVQDVTLHVTLLGGGFGRGWRSTAWRKLCGWRWTAPARRCNCPGRAKKTRLTTSTVPCTWPCCARPLTVRVASPACASSPLAMLSPRAGWAETCRRWQARWIWPTKQRLRACLTGPMAFPHQKMEHVATRMGVPVGFWRSVGHSHNAFFTESFVDELAASFATGPA
jgi:isoquinoline 1-oxidoreductase beta subunit